MNTMIESLAILLMENTLMCMVHQNVFSKLHGRDYSRANNLDPLWCVLLLMKHIASVNGKCVI